MCTPALLLLNSSLPHPSLERLRPSTAALNPRPHVSGTTYGQVDGTAGPQATLVFFVGFAGAVPSAALRLWLGSVQNAWLQEDMNRTSEVLNALAAVTPCSDKAADCADLSTQVNVLLNQLKAGLDFYGNPPNW